MKLDQHSDEPSTLITAWVLKELSPWLLRMSGLTFYNAELKRLYAQHEQLLIIKIKDGSVSFLGRQSSRERYAKRIALYQKLFESVCSAGGLSRLDLLLPIVVEDGSLEGAAIPVFCFQKQRASKCVLLPDLDFMEWDYYGGANLKDSVEYSAKVDCAAFVGATTGAIITKRNIFDRSVPRLRAADYFKSNPLVSFQLASIVQCESDEVSELLRQKGYGTGVSSWQEQFKNKFLISMDGNGATCSRVVVALKSNSVLLKYKSESILYYFHGLEPGRHYLAIDRDGEVEEIVKQEINSPGKFEHVAKAGAEFADTFLSRSAVEQYTATLLLNYAKIVPPGSEVTDQEFGVS